MIDLIALERSALAEGSDAIVTRAWLKQVLTELQEGRAAQERLGQCFGLPESARL